MSLGTQAVQGSTPQHLLRSQTIHSVTCFRYQHLWLDLHMIPGPASVQLQLVRPVAVQHSQQLERRAPGPMHALHCTLQR